MGMLRAGAIALVVAALTAVAGTTSAKTTAPALRAPADPSMAPLAVYITIKQPSGTFVLGSARAIGAAPREQLMDLAKARNIYVVLPRMSDILQEAMTAARIAAQDSNSLRSAASRTGAKAVLAGRLVQVGKDEWSVNWSLSNEIGVRRWAVAKAAFSDALTSGVSVAADVLTGKLDVERYPPPKLYPLISDDVELRQEKDRRAREQATEPQ